MIHPQIKQRIDKLAEIVYPANPDMCRTLSLGIESLCSLANLQGYNDGVNAATEQVREALPIGREVEALAGDVIRRAKE